MKLLGILLMSCLSVLGQPSLTTGSGIDWRSGLPSPSVSNCFNFNFGSITSGIIYMRYMAYDSTNFGHTGTGNKQLCVSNLADAATMLLADDATGTPITNTPSGGPNGFYAMDFSNAGYNPGNYLHHVTIAGANVDGSNSPNTIFIVCIDKPHANPGATLFDSLSGGSGTETARLLNNAPGSYMAGATTALTGWNSANTLNWFILTYQFNSTLSFMRTNGVKALAGTVDASAWGRPMFGQDHGGTTGYQSKMWAILAYAGAMNTNELTIIEQVLNCQGNLGYTIPLP